MSGDYYSQLQKTKGRLINTDKTMHKSYVDGGTGKPDNDKALAVAASVAAKLDERKCLLCGQGMPGLQKHDVYGYEVWLHPLCLSDFAAKLGHNSQESHQEKPMGKDMASKALSRDYLPMSKDLGTLMQRGENERKAANRAARALAEKSHAEMIARHGDALRAAGIISKHFSAYDRGEED